MGFWWTQISSVRSRCLLDPIMSIKQLKVWFPLTKMWFWWAQIWLVIGLTIDMCPELQFHQTEMPAWSNNEHQPSCFGAELRLSWEVKSDLKIPMNEKICAISICRDGNENWYHLIPHPQAMHPWVSWKPQAMQCMDTPGTLLGILKSLWIWRDSNKNLSPPWSNAWVNQPLPSASSFHRVQQLLKATPDTCMGTCWYLEAFIGYILVLLCRPRHPLKVTFCSIFGIFRFILILLPWLDSLLSNNWNLSCCSKLNAGFCMHPYYELVHHHCLPGA